MNKIIVYNHNYQLKYFKGRFDKAVKIGAFENIKNDENNLELPLLETLSLSDNFKLKRKIKKLIKSIIFGADEIIIFGCQDYFSFFAYKISLALKKEVSVVPDNIEFFLRPGIVKSSFTLKRLIKTCFFNLMPLSINKNFSFINNRILYTIDKSHVSNNSGFYALNEIREQIYCDKNRTVFISQPYYIDYGLDEEYWINTFLTIMNNLGLNTLEIKFHQRDTDSFKSKILKRGFQEYTGNLEDAGIVYGFFSTLLFELALDGKKVFSLFEQIKHFFPADYLKFIEFIANELNIKLNGHDLWSLTSNDFYSLTNKVFK